MPRFAQLLVLVLSLPMPCGCSGEAPPSTDGVGAPVETPRRPERERGEELYDAQGVPLESDERVAGLVLPRGLTKNEPVSTERRHVYSSRVPPGRLLRYFGPRLTTVQIDRRGESVTYRESTVRGARGGEVKLDVSIRPSSAHEAVVEIVERPPPPPEGMTVPADEIRRHLGGLNERRE